jgi:hypothetical protein
MPSDFLAPLIDPTAPLPAIWPTGAWGAFLLFLIPIGGGIPLGVLMGRDAGLSPLVMAGMYFVSDIFMAVTHEPFFWLLGWLANLIPALGKVREFFRKASAASGLSDDGAQGPLGLILFSFTVDPISGRGAAAAAGHGFFAGWSFAIAGDMIYFGVLMAATLWLSGLFGDDRTTVGVVLLTVWGLSWWIRRKRRSSRTVGQPAAQSAGQRTGQPGGRAVTRRPATLVPAMAGVGLDHSAAGLDRSAAGLDRSAAEPARPRPDSLGTRPRRKKAGRNRRSR